MGKLQPTYSYKGYNGNDEEEREKHLFYQLEQEHVQVSNSVNATIDDESFFTKERVTSFIWLDNKPIWKKTISGTVVGTAVTTYAHGIKGISTIIALIGAAQQQSPLTGKAYPLPYLDPATLANSVGVSMDAANITLNAPNNNLNNYLFNITIYYTKS